MKSNIRRKIPVTGALLLAISSVMISCTKEVPYKQVYKENVETKAALSPDDEYLFVASSDLSNNDDAGVSNATPYWQGEEKIVKFRFTENNLQVLQVNDESRLAKDNTLNDKVLMEIPIKNVEYRCSEDKYGKCTNKEEENSEIKWDKKSKFIPDFNGMKVTGFTMLPVEMQQLYGWSCFSETSSRFLNYELKDDALNIQIEKVFRGNPECLGSQMYSVNSVDELQSQIIYHYSFTKLSKAASPNYKAIDYPKKDQNTFGFFTTENRKYDVDMTRTQKNQNEYMNRWNPDRKEIVYYMSDNFDKPQYKAIKQATRVAFDRVNAGLKAAGIDSRLVLKDPAHKQVGDTRNSMIVMVEDPVAGGPLGYGPTVANPRTGEIISGRVAMYYGNFVQSVSYTYDEVVREMSKEAVAKANAAAAPLQADALLQNKQQNAAYTKYWMSDIVGYKIANSYVGAKHSGSTVANSPYIAKSAGVTKESLQAYSRKQIRETVSNSAAGVNRFQTKGTLTAAADAAEGLNQTDSAKAIDALAVMSKYCNYPSELFPFAEYIKTALQGKLGNNMKLWADLSDSEKEEVIAIIMPEVWVPTLVHELGHNLGLRHNFSGSEDRLNFYTQNELAKMGVKHEIPYSSVMDYGYSELNLLPTLGKYDIAALRFAYKREVQTETGGTVQVPTTLSKLVADTKDLSLRDFAYCSDEGVELNPGCKRFDKGTNYTEIVKFMIENYKDRYYMRNLRNGRESFSKIQTGAYFSGTLSRFQYIRNFMETYSDLKRRFNLTDDSPVWETVEWLHDLKQATLLSGRFFMDVMKTPEMICAVAKKSEPTKIVDWAPLKQISESAQTCADLELANDMIVVAEGGKPFNDIRFKDNKSDYADQIDVRGIGPDKIAAAQALFTRSAGGTRQHEDNYMDIKDLAPEISSTVAAILFDQVSTKTDVRDLVHNKVQEYTVTTSMFQTPDEARTAWTTHWFDISLLSNSARRMGLPVDRRVSFQEQLLKTISGRMSSSQTHHAEDKAFVDQFRVNRIAKTALWNTDSKVAMRDSGSFKAVATQENSVAQSAISTINKRDLLMKLSDKDLSDLKTERLRPRNMPRTGPVTSAAANNAEYNDVRAEDISMFQSKALPSKEKLDYLLTILPGAEEAK